eukprot:910295-Pelagomonas_calceolata.AAC.9
MAARARSTGARLRNDTCGEHPAAGWLQLSQQQGGYAAKIQHFHAGGLKKRASEGLFWPSLYLDRFSSPEHKTVRRALPSSMWGPPSCREEEGGIPGHIEILSAQQILLLCLGSLAPGNWGVSGPSLSLHWFPSCILLGGGGGGVDGDFVLRNRVLAAGRKRGGKPNAQGASWPALCPSPSSLTLASPSTSPANLPACHAKYIGRSRQCKSAARPVENFYQKPVVVHSVLVVNVLQRALPACPPYIVAHVLICREGGKSGTQYSAKAALVNKDGKQTYILV